MFEGLAYSNTIEIEDFPEKWVPLIYPYDPDLPLFPIYYFHELLVENWDEYRPSETDRVYGYMNNYNFQDGTLFAEIISNKICCLLRINWCCDFYNVTKLEKLMIIDSRLSGTIPESICNLQNLNSVNLLSFALLSELLKFFSIFFIFFLLFFFNKYSNSIVFLFLY